MMMKNNKTKNRNKILTNRYGEKVAALAVAYNNWAVQKELLGGREECPRDALDLYRKALHLATDHLEAEHPLRARFEESVNAVVARNSAAQENRAYVLAFN